MCYCIIHFFFFGGRGIESFSRGGECEGRNIFLLFFPIVSLILQVPVILALDKIIRVLTQYGSTSHLPLAAKAFSKFEYPGCFTSTEVQKGQSTS